MPMPIDLLVEYSDGTMKVLRSIANDEFRKPNPNQGVKRTF
jgi:hypothetical protein